MEKKHKQLLKKPHLDKTKLKDLEQRIKVLKNTIKKLSSGGNKVDMPKVGDP